MFGGLLVYSGTSERDKSNPKFWVTSNWHADGHGINWLLIYVNDVPVVFGRIVWLW